VPRASEIAVQLAPHFSTSRMDLNVLLIDGARQAAVVATPGTLDGTMLMFYNTVVDNAAMLQTWSLIIGFAILFLVSFFASYTIPVRQPSVLSVLHEEGKPHLLRPFWVLLLLVGFFVMVFNLLFEWMTITNDAPLLVLGGMTLFVLYIVHHTFRFDSFIEHIGAIGGDFYGKVTHLFMAQRTILLGISGFLVLHLITDIGNFIAPSLFGWYTTLYQTQAPGSHDTVVSMVMSSLGTSTSQNALIIAAYVLSIAGILLLLALPAIIWCKIFKMRTSEGQHLPDWSKWQIGLSLAAVTVYFLVPVFTFSSLGGGDLIGVNITSNPIAAADVPRVMMALGIGFGIFVLCVVLGMINDYVRRVLMLGPFGVTIVFFAIYIYHYFSSSFVYFSQLLVEILREGIASYAVLPMLFAIFGFTVFFFIAGFFSFLYEIWRD
jgi:hypothetical protein